MVRCKIQWIDAEGNPTPDENPAVGHAIHYSFMSGESRTFPICAEHAARVPIAPCGAACAWDFEPFQLDCEAL